jgi:hypothetical protein
MATFAPEIDVTRATFTPLDAKGNAQPHKKITVHFNPASLQLQLSNTLEDKGGKTTEQVKTSSAKLTMDLVFDTTEPLTDVRVETQKFVDQMTPKQKKVTALLFEWGTFTFTGMIESYKETLDFFSSDGVPLRAGVNLTLSHRDVVFGSTPHGPAATQGPKREEGDPYVTNEEETFEALNPPRGLGVTSTKDDADVNGSQDSGRGIAAENGLENMRFPEGPLVVAAGITLSPPVAFAAGGAGIAAGAGAAFGAGAGAAFGAAAGAAFGGGAGVSAGIGAGFGAGVGAGFGAGVSAGFGAAGSAAAGLGASARAGFGGVAAGTFAGAGAFAGAAGVAGAGAFVTAGAVVGAGAFGTATTVFGAAIVAPGEAPIFGGRASAGVPASLGAFAGLRVALPRPRPVLDPSLLLPSRPTAALAADAHASFDLTGRARATAGAGFAAAANGRSFARGGVSFE